MIVMRLDEAAGDQAGESPKGTGSGNHQDKGNHTTFPSDGVKVTVTDGGDCTDRPPDCIFSRCNVALVVRLKLQDGEAAQKDHHNGDKTTRQQGIAGPVAEDNCRQKAGRLDTADHPQDPDNPGTAAPPQRIKNRN